MGSFQITYDDFSGGQYMGSKSTNLPKNTFFGENVVSLPNGRLCPTGSILAGQDAGVVSASNAQIFDTWTVGADTYSFAMWSGTTSKMCKVTAVNNGTLFPITSTNTSLTGTLGGNVAYVPAESKFYYVNTNSSTFGYIRSVTTTGTDASVSTVLGSGTGITNLALYGYRLVAWGATSKRLYFSDTALTGWSATQYYEMNGQILNVLPRANDLLVVTDVGVFSVIGVLGSSVNIQLIVPSQNVTEGMRDATVVGRNMMYLDQSLSGDLDGSIKQLVGSYQENVFTMILEDILSTGGGFQSARIQSINDGRIVVILRNGICYAQTNDKKWTKLNFTPPTSINTTVNQMTVARPGPNSQNEYFVFAVVANESKYPIKWYRANNNIVALSNLDANNSYTTASTGGSSAPTGNAQLPEYWHNKTFKVKNIIVEWAGKTNSTVSIQTEPTGVVDSTFNTGMNSAFSTTQLSAISEYTLQTERLFVNDASAGYGIKPTVYMTNAIVNRVILVCED